METFADTSAFNAGVKEKNTKTNKPTIVKNQNLQHKSSLKMFLFYYKIRSGTKE
jgi:hypothetical protein